MAGDIVIGMLYNVALPLVLLTAIAFRYNGLSVVYLLFLLSVPLLPSPALSSMKGELGAFCVLKIDLGCIVFLFLYTVECRGFLFLHYLFSQQVLVKMGTNLKGNAYTFKFKCGIQITFAYIPKEMSGPMDNVFFHLGIVRFSDVDAGNIIRLLVPDIGVFMSSLVIRNLCKKLLRPPTNDHEHQSEIEEASETSESEYEEESEASSTESSVAMKAAPSGPPQFVQKLIVFATGLRLLLSTMMNTAGKVVVSVLLGLAGIADKTELSSMVNRMGAFLKGLLVKYWIVCCCSMFFVISFSGKVVVYKILYICLFLFCVVLYQ
ncbi:piezo-type mechanosensitive ion channel component 2-like, partial [Clarias magur]